MQVTGQEAADYSKLLETMTAREYLSRHEPRSLDQFPEDVEALLEYDTARAEAAASRFNIPPSPTGAYPHVIWVMATAADCSALA